MTLAAHRFGRLSLSTLALTVLLLAPGCTRYEYDIVHPPELARHVGPEWTAASMDPVEYRFCTYENYLVLQVWNNQRDPIQLLGDRSVVVDPHGQSHPLRTQMIAPGSYLKLVLPPAPGQVYQYGPSVSFGVGVGVSHCHGHPWHGGYYGSYYDPFWYDQPRYIAVYDNADNAFWNWDGEVGEARVVLVFDRGGKAFTHEMVFRRKKM